MSTYRLLELGYWRMVATFIDVALLTAAVLLFLAVVVPPLRGVRSGERVRPQGPRRRSGSSKGRRTSVLVRDVAIRKDARGAAGSLPVDAFGSSRASSAAVGSAHRPTAAVSLAQSTPAHGIRGVPTPRSGG